MVKVNPSQLRAKINDTAFELATFRAMDVYAALLWLRQHIQKYSYTTQEGGYGPDVISTDELDDLINRAFFDVVKIEGGRWDVWEKDESEKRKAT